MFGLMLFVAIMAILISFFISTVISSFSLYMFFFSRLFFVLLFIIVAFVSIKIYIIQPEATEMCKMRCPYYNSWSTPEKYQKYMECADICEHGQSLFAPRKRKGF